MRTPTPKPVAFMVMPFGKRNVPHVPKTAPKKIDFDTLWDNAFKPALEELGYIAVRADMESGSVIINDMLARLAFADLVLADITLPNGNVYYEVGIRHVARKTDCVLISAEWSELLFDIKQMRSLRYPLKDGTVPGKEALSIRKKLIKEIDRMKNEETPYYRIVTGTDAKKVFRKEMEVISSFQAEVKAARMPGSKEERASRVRTLVKKIDVASLRLADVAFELLMLIRDNLLWKDVIGFIGRLPKNFRNHSFTIEQKLLALSKMGDHVIAIAELEELVRLQGETPERLGLIGGRFKELWRKARNARVKRGKKEPGLIEKGYLEQAIEHYRRGMNLDLNEYFCMCNLPLLLRYRKKKGDAEDAAFLDRMTMLVTQRKIDRGEDDGWARKTLLGAAFRLQDIDEVEKQVNEVAKEAQTVWQLKSTMVDIDDTLNHIDDKKAVQSLRKYRDQLMALMK